MRRGGQELDSRALADQIGNWIAQTPGLDYVIWIDPNTLKPGDVLIELFAGTVRGADLTMPFQLLANYTIEQLVQPKRN